jgi:hypothetical protein
MRYEMTDEKWARAMWDFVERSNPEYTRGEIAVLVAELLDGSEASNQLCAELLGEK